MTIETAVPSVVQQGLNEWTVLVHDASGNAIDGTLTISSMMPDHNHAKPDTRDRDAQSRRRVRHHRINLSMRGVWQITLAIASPTLSDTVTFMFCVDGATDHGTQP